MAYIGIGPASFTNNLTNVQILDDIKAGFNGSTTTFNLTSSSIPFHAVSDRALMVILGGVIQAPGVDYTINLAQITFTTPPVSGLTFYARNIYGLNALNLVNDGIVGPYSLTTGGPTWDTSGNTTISGNLTVQGATTTISSTTLDVIDKDIKIASNQSTNAGIDTAGLLWGTTAVKLKFYNNGGTNPGLNIEGTNVGINTTAPTEKLHVTGNIKASGTVTSTSGIIDSTLTAGRVVYVDSDKSLLDNGNLTYNGNRLTVTGDIKVSGSQNAQLTTNQLIFDRAGYSYIDNNNDSGSLAFRVTSSSTIGLLIDNNAQAIFGSSLIIPDAIQHVGDLDTQIRFAGSDTIQLETGGSIRLKIDANGVVQVTRRLELTNSGDNHYIYQGRAWAWSSNGTSTGTIRGYLYGDSSGNLRIGANSDWGEDLRITSGGSLKLPDNGKIEFGGAQDVAGDLSIYHQSSDNNSQIHNTTGTLRIRGDSIKLNNAAANKNAIVCESNIVTLFYDNAARLATNSNGISVTGEVAASQDYPDYRPSLNFNFAAAKKLDSRITYTRKGPASFTDEFGIVVLVGGNVPRFDHDPTTRESKGLLIEESRTNLFSGSANMAATGSRWTTGGSRGAKGANVKSPDGKMTAYQNVYNGTGGDLNIYYSPVGGANELTTANDTTYTMSVWAKLSAGASYITGIRLRTYNQNISVNYNLATGVVLGDGSNAANAYENQNSDFISSSIEEYPDGWYRCIMTFKSGTDGNQGFQIYMISGTNNHALNSSGANGESVSFWGVQLEAGSFATSFIPTYNDQESVTRGADQVTVEGTEFTDFYNDIEGTFVVSHSILPEVPNAENCYVFEVSDGGATHVAFRYNDVNSSFSNKPAFSSVYSSGLSASMNATGTYTRGAIVKGAMTAKHNSFKATWNGETVQTDTSGSIFGPGTTGQLAIGRYNPSAGYELNGHIQKMMYWPKQLSSNQLKTLTS